MVDFLTINRPLYISFLLVIWPFTLEIHFHPGDIKLLSLSIQNENSSVHDIITYVAELTVLLPYMHGQTLSGILLHDGEATNCGSCRWLI